MYELEWLDQRLSLRADKTLFWHERRTLIVADPHFGKTATFRAAGIPIPGGTTAADLQRLTHALEATGATRLILLGDFLHAKAGRDQATLAALADWNDRHAHLERLLVRGNHDTRAGDPPEEWGIECVDEPAVELPFVWRHIPQADDAGYVVAGHLHPAVVLTDGARGRMRAPCFAFGPNVALLPAFGAFTGTARYTPAAGDRLFVVGEGHVLEAAVA